MPQRLSRPERLERTRCAIARELFQHAYLAKAAVLIAPKNHPWKKLVGSAMQDLNNLTEMTLHPRMESGQVQVPPKPTRRRVPFKALVATYLVASQFIPLLPSVVFYHGNLKIYPAQAAGLTEEPLIAPRLRVYITDDIREDPEAVGAPHVGGR